MKKITFFVIVVSLLVLPLFAQGKQEVADKPVSIELWYGAAMTEAGPIPEDWVGFDLIREKLNIDLSLSAVPSNPNDQDVKIQAAAAANNLPDVFFVSRPVLANLIKQGLVAKLDDLYDMMPNRTAKYHDFDSINYATISGANYGMAVPNTVVGNEALVLRKDWLDRLGLKAPTNLDEFYDVLYAFTYNDPDGNGIKDTYGYGAFFENDATLKGFPGSRFWPIMGAFGVTGVWQFNKEDLGLTIYKPEFYDFMVYARKIIEAGLIDPNFEAYKKDDFRAAWKQGKFGAIHEQWAALSAESNYLPFDMNFPNGEWVIVGPLAGPKGDAAAGSLDKSYRIYAVSQKSVNQGKLEAIARLFDWLGTEEAYYLLGYGTEGVNYVLNDRGQPSSANLGNMSYTGPVGQVQTQLRNLIYFNSPEEIAIRFPDYITANSKKTMSPQSFMAGMANQPWKMAVGSGMMPTPSNDVLRFYEQSLAEFLSGSRALTPQNWAAFIDQFNKMGGKAWNDAGIQYMKENNLII
ncbi:MAG: Lipoprotein LipO precursor [Spirochaetes bacterium ADurb.Bin315]|jgi:putative aldouronate transport system substrate-binding protein|nr:MAG: Lipoprotein LipO precursor [Spirochaetes bacterium ADurb.Bin315]